MEFILEYKTATAAQKVGDKVTVSADVAEIGRDASCQIQIDESCSTVSRKHAKIERDGNRYKITSISQTNSTYVNGTPVKGECYLNSGDEIKFSSQGPTVIFKLDDPRATRKADPTSTTSTQPNAAAAPAAAPVEPAPAPKKSNLPLIIGIVAVLAAAILAAVFFLNKEEEPAPEPVEVAAPSIESVYNSIYYIKVNDISVYDQKKALVMKFNTEDKISGTGFMLSNGKFVTAKSVVEPWIIAEDVFVGNDSIARSYTYNELVGLGYDVVTTCTAYTAAGTSFKFSNTDCMMNEVGGDWVTLAKSDQLSTVGGLECDVDWSIAPQHGTECQIVGYLPNADIQNLVPEKFTNAVNVTELNKDKLIELSSQRWQKGLSGAPVIIDNNGQLVVIGIMTNSNIANRDVVIPIAYILN